MVSTIFEKEDVDAEVLSGDELGSHEHGFVTLPQY